MENPGRQGTSQTKEVEKGTKGDFCQGAAVHGQHRDACVGPCILATEERPFLNRIQTAAGQGVQSVGVVDIGGDLAVQSGRIEPGNQVTELDLTEDGAALLQPGGYEGHFLVSYYDRLSGEKALVSTEIPITVTVTG